MQKNVRTDVCKDVPFQVLLQSFKFDDRNFLKDLGHKICHNGDITVTDYLFLARQAVPGHLKFQQYGFIRCETTIRIDLI